MISGAALFIIRLSFYVAHEIYARRAYDISWWYDAIIDTMPTRIEVRDSLSSCTVTNARRRRDGYTFNY